MNFVFGYWEDFCRQLQTRGIHSIPACEITRDHQCYLVLKHDVETNVTKAYKMAQIETKYGHRGSYYVQAYLLNNQANILMLKKMQQMGHEVSYHYDVMDSSKGNLDNAIREFDDNCAAFEENGFSIKTVSQHGNPVVIRNGYHSNRDFFRNPDVRKRYPGISDIMVNYKETVPTEFLYFSDAGRQLKQIFDPLNNDIVNSDDRNILFRDLDALLKGLSHTAGNIVSVHPHRWTNTALEYAAKRWVFQWARAAAKMLFRIPAVRGVMSRYYYLAKKI